MSEITIEVQPREETGKNASRRMRAAGEIPAVVYGGGKEAVPIAVEEKMMHQFLRDPGNENALFVLRLGKSGKKRHAMIRALDLDPVRRTITHIDFLRVMLDEKVRTEVTIELVGTPEGVKNEGGVLDFMLREVEVECLPTEIPSSLTLEVGHLELGDQLEVKDLEFPEGVELLGEESRIVVAVAHSRVEAELEEAEAEAEELEGALIEAEAEEPEVIGRVKEEEEEEEND